jgi:hypothetical protein
MRVERAAGNQPEDGVDAAAIPADSEDSMANRKPAVDSDRIRAQRHLRQLIAALDRRVPHVERVGEVDIARAATALKKKAMERLVKLAANDPSTDR